jgi:SAM-dependent methyltransferase
MNGVTDRMSRDSASQHYGIAYFDWQRSIGAFGGKANRFRYQPYIRPNDRVVDFGCGGGFLLRELRCGERRGVEVNPAARAEAERNGITCVASAAELPTDWADVVISHSALEHVEYPLGELRSLVRRLRPGGIMVFSVPHETLAAQYSATDINQHLHTWSPRALGNLFAQAGISVERVYSSRMMWPPKYQLLYRLLGEQGFLRACATYRWIRMALWPLKPVDSHALVTVVGRRPEEARLQLQPENPTSNLP